MKPVMKQSISRSISSQLGLATGFELLGQECAYKRQQDISLRCGAMQMTASDMHHARGTTVAGIQAFDIRTYSAASCHSKQDDSLLQTAFA